jgi:hypothetical protein
VVFCSLLEHQVPILKESFSRAFDLVALNADIKTQVGFASSLDVFKISHMSTKDKKVNSMAM